MKLLEWLRIPETQAVRDLDDPSTTLLYAKIIQNKPFLKNIYLDFYSIFKEAVNYQENDKRVFVELGSGGGFLKKVIPTVTTTDVIALPDIDQCFSALNMPYGNNTVDAFFMIDVLHHIPDASRFLKEATRCLKPGGRIIMIEPSNTFFSRIIYRFFHQEPFDPKAGWKLSSDGPLSSANIAIPWIIFIRDRKLFETNYPELKITNIYNHTPFRYLISGGVTVRQLLPNFSYNFIKIIESVLTPLNNYLGMFITIELENN